MADDAKATLEVFASAVRALLHDKDLAYANPSEPAIVARLRNLLHGQYEGWSIDLEWSRREDLVKRLRYRLTEEQIRDAAIIPDLIVHKVGKRENLLVVEIKKVTNNDFGGDVWKLAGMTEQSGEYAYLVGLHLVVDVKRGVAPRCDVYIDAKLDKTMTEWMHSILGTDG